MKEEEWEGWKVGSSHKTGRTGMSDGRYVWQVTGMCGRSLMIKLKTSRSRRKRKKNMKMMVRMEEMGGKVGIESRGVNLLIMGG